MMEGAGDFCHLCVEWLIKYGPVLLFFLLALGIVAFPIPDDTLLLVSGMLIEMGKFHAMPTFLFAIAGSIAGITMSYTIGRVAGPWLFKKFRGRFGLKEERIQKAHDWFSRIGKWTLLICYFLPVLRHIAGFVAGSTQLRLTQFMAVAYTGALLWVSSYLTLGYYLKKLAAHGVKLLF